MFMRCRGSWGEGRGGGKGEAGRGTEPLCLGFLNRHPGKGTSGRVVCAFCACVWEEGIKMKSVPETPSSIPARLGVGQDSQEQFCKSQGISTELGDGPGCSPLDSPCWLGWVSLPVQVYTQNSIERCGHCMNAVHKSLSPHWIQTPAYLPVLK